MGPGPQLHPELAQLERRYDELVDRVEAHELSLEDARAALEALVVIDGDGSHWGLTEDGDFYRSRPGESRQVADPTKFVPPRLPLRPGEAPSPPWVRPGEHPLEVPEPVIAPPRSLGAPRAGLAGVLVRLPGGQTLLSSRLFSDRRNLWLAGIVVILLGIVIFVHGSSSPPRQPANAGIPAVGANPGAPAGGGSPTSGSAVGTSPGSGSESTSGASSPTVPVATVPGVSTPAGMPSEADVLQITSGLTSGKRGLVASVVATHPSPRALAYATALFGGAARSGLSLVPSGNPAMVKGSARWRLRLVNDATNTTFFAATVTLVRVHGAWKLAALPDFPDPLAKT